MAETKAKLQRAMSREGGRPTPAKKEVRRQSSSTTPAPVRRKTAPVKIETNQNARFSLGVIGHIDRIAQIGQINWIGQIGHIDNIDQISNL